MFSVFRLLRRGSARHTRQKKFCCWKSREVCSAYVQVILNARLIESDDRKESQIVSCCGLLECPLFIAQRLSKCTCLSNEPCKHCRYHRPHFEEDSIQKFEQEQYTGCRAILANHFQPGNSFQTSTNAAAPERSWPSERLMWNLFIEAVLVRFGPRGASNSETSISFRLSPPLLEL